MAHRKLLELFAENLRAERARARLSQEALGSLTNLTSSYISKLERGERDPPLSTVEGLAQALKVDAVILLRARAA